MENGNTNTTTHRKVTFIILISLITLMIVYYSVMSMMSPAQKLKEIKSEFEAKALIKKDVDQKILQDSTYMRLFKQRIFLQSRIVMAETDSIYLTVNLADSTANIEICGVIVHKIRMSDIKTSIILQKSDERSVLSILSSPATISNAFATIRKEPVMIKMAPKDTSEYKPDIMPDTSIVEPVNYMLEMSNGIRIYVYQEENTKFDDKMSQLSFDFKDRLRDTWNSIKKVAVLKVPDYHLFIKMKLPRSDAKIIYRAIPKNGQIAVFS